MALQDPSAPFSPWDVPPSSTDLDAAMAAAYGDPVAPDGQILDSLFSPIALIPPTTAPTPMPMPERKPDPIPFDPEEAKYHPGRADDKTNAHTQKSAADGEKRVPRTDAARIGAFGAPVPPEEVALQGMQWPDPDARLTPEEEAQIEIDGGNIEMPDDFVGRTEADAISGVGANVAFPAPDQGPPGVRGEVPDSDVSSEMLGARLSERSLEEQEMFRGQVEGGREQMRQAAKEVIETQALWEAEKNAKALRRAMQIADEKSATLDKEAAAIGNEKITPLKDVSSMSKIFGVAAAILGGFSANKTGRNLGLETVDSIIEDSIAVQTANLNNRKQMLVSQQNAIQEQLARGKDLYQAQETVRLATYDQLARKLEADVQQYDPPGTRALKTMDTINAIKSKRAALLAKYRDDELKRVENLLKEERERAQLLETQRHNIAGERNDATRAYSDLIKAKAEATKAKAEADAAGPKARKLEADATKAEAEADAATTGYYVNDPETSEPLKDKEGRPVRIMDTTARERLSKQVAAAKQIRKLADRMKALKEKNGGNWSALGSAEAQEMKTLVSMVDFETFKAFDLGAPSEGDKALAEGVRGGSDPSSFIKKSTAGFETYANEVEGKVNTALGVAGIAPLRFTRRADAPKADTSVIDQLVSTAAGSEYTADPRGTIEKATGTPAVIHPKVAAQNKLVEDALAGLAAHADQPTELGDQARAGIAKIATGAVSPEVRAKAKAMLEALPGRNVRGDEAR